MHNMLSGNPEPIENSSFDEAREKVRQELIEQFKLDCPGVDQNELLI